MQELDWQSDLAEKVIATDASYVLASAYIWYGSSTDAVALADVGNTSFVAHDD